MKICYIADVNSIHSQRIINHFAQAGHEIHVLSINKPKPGYYDEKLNLTIHFIGPFPSGKKTHPKFFFKQLGIVKRIRRILKKVKPDILHSFFITDCGFYGALTGFRPFVVFAMGSDILIHPNRSFIFRCMYKFVLRRADVIHCQTNYAKQILCRDGGYRYKVRAFPFGVDLSLFKKHDLNPEFLKSLGLDNGNKVVISTRSLDKPLYSVETLILAAPYIIVKHPETRFLILGDGRLKSTLEALARDLGVGDIFSFLGFVPNSDIPKFLNYSHIYVSTSISDDFSISTLEAMACAKPVVVTDIPGTSELIKDGWNGYVFSKQDHHSLATQITDLIKNRKLAEQMGERNRQLIEAKGSVTLSMEQIYNLYTELVGGRVLP